MNQETSNVTEQALQTVNFEIVLSNQWVLLKEPCNNFHCMEVITTEDKLTGYIIDYREGFTTTTNDYVDVVYIPSKERWEETCRRPRV